MSMKKLKKILSLSTETVRSLNDAEIRGAAGGSGDDTYGTAKTMFLTACPPCKPPGGGGGGGPKLQ
jgi:hypothetical protein